MSLPCTAGARSGSIRGYVVCGILIALATLCKANRSPAADPPDEEAIAKAVEKGLAYLKRLGPTHKDGRATIAGLAMLKAELPQETPEIQRILEGIQAKVKNGVYTPGNLHEHGYEAGLDAITLEAADSEKYKPEIEAIAQYLIRVQNKGGDWNYPNETIGGDTSITQYGLLGLWAATRAGIRVPTETWDRAASWLVSTQDQSGGFRYHPINANGELLIGMSTAGTASLHLCRMHLYPNADVRTLKTPEAQLSSIARPNKRFGVLEKATPRDPDGNVKPAKEAKPVAYAPKVPLSRIDDGINRGMDWVARNFTIEKANHFKLYYLYTLERLTALANVQTIGDHDWYAEGADHLLSQQTSEGIWTSSSGPIPDTAFAVLFLVRATNKMMDRKAGPRKVGGGLLAGGRGLPDNLAAMQVRDGKVQSRKVQGGLDELLSELENQKSNPVESVQKAIVETIQLGDREKLIGQTDRLKQLAVHPRPEVRRTALWALGRGRELRIASLLLAALEDSDVDVVVEANNALCYLSRRPQGVGIPENPLEGLDEEATAEQRTTKLNAWRKEAAKRWKAWYLTVRPFDERHDLDEPRPSR